MTNHPDTHDDGTATGSGANGDTADDAGIIEFDGDPVDDASDGHDDVDASDDAAVDDADPADPDATGDATDHDGGDSEDGDDDAMIGAPVAPPPVAAPGAALVGGRSVATAAEVREWAARWDVADDPYVVGVSRALDARSDLTAWANLDPLDLLPMPEPRSGSLLQVIARLLTVLRNVAVFIPVALTWMAINRATDAFGRYADEQQGNEVNFLQFWQSGGPDGEFLSPFWRIQDVAFKVALIVTFIVAATLLAGALQARADAKSRRARLVSERERVQVGVDLAGALTGSRTADPASIAESLAIALNDLSQAAREVAVAAARIENATVGVNALNPQVDKLTQSVSQLSDRLSGEVNETVGDLSKSVSVLGVTLGGDVHRFLTDILTSLEEVDDRLGRTSVAVEFGTKQLREDLSALHGQLSGIVRSN